MIYRLSYIKETLHGGRVFEIIENIVVTNLKDIEKYKIYYLIDSNGDILIDNRFKEVTI